MRRGQILWATTLYKNKPKKTVKNYNFVDSRELVTYIGAKCAK